MKMKTLLIAICFCFISIFAGGAAPPNYAKQDSTEQVVFQNDTVTVQMQLIDINSITTVIHVSTDNAIIYTYYLPSPEATKLKEYNYAFEDPCRVVAILSENNIINKIRASKNNIEKTLLWCGCGGAGYLCHKANNLI